MSTKSGLAVMTKLMPSYKRVMQRAQFPLGRCTTQNYVKRFHQNNLCRTTIIKNPTNRLEYSVSLYTALKICQGISTTIVPNKKTVITLELQLYYIKAIQLRDHDQVGNDFFFSVGELHVVFAMCHAILLVNISTQVVQTNSLLNLASMVIQLSIRSLLGEKYEEMPGCFSYFVLLTL